MSLNWNISKIEKYKDNLDDAYIAVNPEGSGEQYYDVKPQLKTFIFWGAVAGFGSISKANAAEYYARSKVYEKYNKSSFMERWTEEDTLEPMYLTMEMVDETIGLSTNHSTVSTTEWVKRINKYLTQGTSPGVSVLKAEVILKKHEYQQWEAQKQKELEGK